MDELNTTTPFSIVRSETSTTTGITEKDIYPHYNYTIQNKRNHDIDFSTRKIMLALKAKAFDYRSKLLTDDIINRSSKTIDLYTKNKENTFKLTAPIKLVGLDTLVKSLKKLLYSLKNQPAKDVSFSYIKAETQLLPENEIIISSEIKSIPVGDKLNDKDKLILRAYNENIDTFKFYYNKDTKMFEIRGQCNLLDDLHRDHLLEHWQLSLGRWRHEWLHRKLI